MFRTHQTERGWFVIHPNGLRSYGPYYTYAQAKTNALFMAYGGGAAYTYRDKLKRLIALARRKLKRSWK